MSLSFSPQAVLVDLAGVLHIDDQPIPGALEALRRLRASGLPLCFLTNTTRSPRRAVVAMLRGMGFELDAPEVLTAVLATRTLIRQRGLQPYTLVHPDIVEDIGPSAQAPDAVVLGDAGAHFTYERLNEAFRLLMQGKPLIAMARNRYFREKDGLSLDMGAFVSALEYSSGVQAEIVGKPAMAFFHAALALLGVGPQVVVLIGDDVEDDVGGAQRAGIAGVLVRTGKYRPGDESRTAQRPALVVDDFSAAVEAILARV